MALQGYLKTLLLLYMFECGGVRTPLRVGSLLTPSFWKQIQVNFWSLLHFFETGSHCNLAGFKFANDPEFQIFLSLQNRIKCFSELGVAVYSFDPSIW